MRKYSLMTPKEVASYLRVSQQTIYRLLKKKKLPGAFKLGYDWRIDKATLEEYLATHSSIG